MAGVASQPWEQTWKLLHVDPTAHIAMDFVSGSTGEQFRTKTLCWSLLNMFLTVLEKGNYAEFTFITKLKPATIGVGKVYFQAGEGTPLSTSNATSNPSVVSKDLLGSEDGLSPRPPPPSPSSPSSLFNTTRNSQGLELTIHWTANGRVFPDFSVYFVALSIILSAAQFDTAATAEPVSNYFPAKDISMAVIPSSAAGRDSWKWWMVVRSMVKLTEAMEKEGGVGGGGKWAECTVRVRHDGYNVGKILLTKGRVQQLDLDHLTGAFAAAEAAGAANDTALGNLNQTQTLPLQLNGISPGKETS